MCTGAGERGKTRTSEVDEDESEGEGDGGGEVDRNAVDLEMEDKSKQGFETEAEEDLNGDKEAVLADELDEAAVETEKDSVPFLFRPKKRKKSASISPCEGEREDAGEEERV